MEFVTAGLLVCQRVGATPVVMGIVTYEWRSPP